METKKKKKVNYDTIIYLRINKKEKEKCAEIAKYYGMPNVSTYFRELIRKSIEIYDNRKCK